MIVTRKHLHRRTFLKGMGAAIALPMLDAMTPAFAAAAQLGKSPLRLGFTYVPNGITMGDWTPKGEGARVRVRPGHETARSVPQGHRRAVRPRAQEWQRARRRARRPRARGRLVSHRRASAQDRRRRYPERHLGRSDRGAAPRPAHALRVARARMRRLAHDRQLRFRLFVRLHQQHCVARSGDPDASGDQPAPRLRAAVRGHRHEPHARDARAPHAVPPEHPRPRRRAHDAAARRISVRPIAASSTNT